MTRRWTRVVLLILVATGVWCWQRWHDYGRQAHEASLMKATDTGPALAMLGPQVAACRNEHKQWLNYVRIGLASGMDRSALLHRWRVCASRMSLGERAEVERVFEDAAR